MKRVKIGLLSLAVLFCGLFAPAASRAGDNYEEKIKELYQRIDAMAEEIENIGGKQISRTTLGGYGELHYNNFEDSASPDQLDLHRVILYLSHGFNNWIRFNSELEVEHAWSEGGKTSGEVSFEQAYLEFLFRKELNAKAGLLLIPVGILNETHEPPTFHGVERNEVETNIIPTTWRENGAGIFGTVMDSVNYRFFITNGSKIDGISKPSQGFRQARQKGFKSLSEDFAFSGRMEYVGIPGIKAGASFYTGDSGQNKKSSYGDANITLWDIDLQANMKGFELRGLYTKAYVGDAEKISAAKGLTMGKEMEGWYVEGAYNVFSLLGTEHYLAPFVRYEKLDTHAEVPSGYSRDGANDRTTTTVGVSYRPIPNVAIKADYQFKSNDKPGVGSDLGNQFNLGVGFMF